MHVAELWLYYLRRTGHVSFDPSLRSSVSQTIPPGLSLDAAFLIACQDANGVEHALLQSRGITEVADVLRRAPTTSLAGILIRLGKDKELQGLLANRPREFWLDLLTPLYLPLTPHTDAAYVFAVAVRDSGDGFLWLPAAEMQGHCHIRVSASGQLTAAVFPVDVFGLEPDAPRALPPERLDQSCRPEIRSSLLQLVKEIPRISRQLLASLITNRPSGVYADFHPADAPEAPQLDAWTEQVWSVMEDDLFAIEQCLRWRAYPFDGTARTLPLASWLYSDGDATLRGRRRQALNAMPHGVAALVVESQPDALAAIDQAQPLMETLQQAYGVPAWVVRRTMTWRSTNEGDVLPLSTSARRTPFSMAVQRTRALGLHAPTLPTQSVTAVQWLIDSFDSDRPQFKVPAHLRGRLLHALGRTAARSGWPVAAGLVSKIMRTRLSLCLLDAVASATVQAHLSIDADLPIGPQATSDIVDAWFGELDARAWLRRAKQLSGLPWHAEDADLAHALSMAARESRTDPAEQPPFEGADGKSSIHPLIFPYSAVSRRTSIYPLGSLEALQAEASIMENCLVTQWGSVQRHEQFLVAIETADGGIRANAALQINGNGEWELKDLKGPANSIIDEASPLNESARELAQWMSSNPSALDQSALESFKNRYSDLLRPIDIHKFDRLALQTLPGWLADQALACMPGQGPLETRIRYAIAKAAKRR